MRSHLNVGAILLRCDDPFIPEQIKRKNRYLDLMEFYLKKKETTKPKKTIEIYSVLQGNNTLRLFWVS